MHDVVCGVKPRRRTKDLFKHAERIGSLPRVGRKQLRLELQAHRVYAVDGETRLVNPLCEKRGKLVRVLREGVQEAL